MNLLKKLPDTLIIVSLILVLFVGLSWIVPAGEFDRQEVNNKKVVVKGTYHTVDSNSQGVGALFQAPLKGFVSAADILAFVILVGGAFSMINATGAIQTGLTRMLSFAHNRPKLKIWVIPLTMFFFSLCGATFGMSEETLVFVLITIPMSLSLGYDKIVGVAIPFVGAGAGFAGSFMNPFTVQIAQGFAELELISGWEYRLLTWIIFTVLCILFVMRYARKIEKTGQGFGMDDVSADNKIDTSAKLSGAQIAILLGFLVVIVALIFGVTKFGWYIAEISALFVGLGIFAAIVGRLGAETSIKSFYEGAKEMLPAVMVIAFAKAILVVASDAKIIDTILHGIAGTLDGVPKAISAQGMFLVQSLLNLFVPSGSGQAALTMPLMAPLGDLLGVSRQTTVLAYQFGDGLSNLIIPTSGVTMGILSIAKIPYEKWLKWCWPLMVVLFLAAMVLLVPPVLVFEY